MHRYIAQYQEERDFSRTIRYKIIPCIFQEAQTWRQLQKYFDPCYSYDNLEFYLLGDMVEFTG